MFPDDLLYWLKAQPFRPFRINMNNGRTYDVRHPEFVRLMTTSLIYFWPTEDPDVFKRAEMVGLALINHIEPIETEVAA